MKTITILLAAAVVLVVVVPGLRAILYAHSEEWKLQQRLQHILRHDAE